MSASIGISKDPLCGQSLGTVARDGIAVIGMAVLSGVEFYAPVVVETGRNYPLRFDERYDGEVAINDT